jgi:plasmid stabilization system protein ParE
VRIHPDAEREASRARHYYKRIDPRIAERFERAVMAIVDRIDEAPEQFPKHGIITVNTEARPLFFDVRKAVLPRTFPLVVFYYLRSGEPHILAFAHAKRRPGYWTERQFKK